MAPRPTCRPTTLRVQFIVAEWGLAKWGLLAAEWGLAEWGLAEWGLLAADFDSDRVQDCHRRCLFYVSKTQGGGLSVAEELEGGVTSHLRKSDHVRKVKYDAIYQVPKK